MYLMDWDLLKFKRTPITLMLFTQNHALSFFNLALLEKYYGKLSSRKLFNRIFTIRILLWQTMKKQYLMLFST